jgi:hypothetical protein
MPHAALLLLVLAQAQADAPEPRWSIGPIVAMSRERFTFHFENPSNFDTVETVPHFFEQTYDTDNVWLGGRLRHPVGANRGQFEIAFTPQRTSRADDFDTFFDPDGNVIVTGTTGGASVRSWRVSQRVPFARWNTLAVDIEYAYRRHRAVFHDGDGITTTTRPPSISHRLVTTRETTVSQIHEIALLARRSLGAGANRVDIDFGGAPVALGRLSVELPDKYPGQTLRYNASASSLRGGIAYSRRGAHADVRIGVEALKTFRWRRARALDRHALALSLDIFLH